MGSTLAFLLDKRKLERVQRLATKLIPQLRDKSYQHRLISLHLPSLHYRSIRGDLIFLYKVTPIGLLVSHY